MSLNQLTNMNIFQLLIVLLSFFIADHSYNYIMSENNVERNSGNSFSDCCEDKKYEKLERSNVAKITEAEHVLICVYSHDGYGFKQACEIWKSYFKKSFQLILEISETQDLDETKTHISTFLDKFTVPIRVTIPIFCHGSSLTICNLGFENFFQTILQPIRNIAKQVLIINQFLGNDYSQ